MASGEVELRIRAALADAEEKAWKALSGYKFWMFGYHAARWVGFSRLLGERRANPFRDAVLLAREKINSSREE